MRHFNARALGLIVVPVCIYLFWFYVHFAILDQSGPGDSFMSAAFQETLKNSAIKMKSLGRYHPVAGSKKERTNLHVGEKISITMTILRCSIEILEHFCTRIRYGIRYDMTMGALAVKVLFVCSFHFDDNV